LAICLRDLQKDFCTFGITKKGVQVGHDPPMYMHCKSSRFKK
jgi:hypothetical protein